MFDRSRAAVRRSLRILLAVPIIAVSLGLAACGSDDNASSPNVSGSSETRAASLEQLYEGTFTKPPAEGPEAQAGKEVWVVDCAEFVPGCSEPANAVMEAGEAIGWEMTLFDGQFQTSRYNEGIRQAISSQADGLVLVGIDCPQVRQPLQEVGEAGIESVGLYSFDCDDPSVGGKSLFSTEIQFNEEAKDLGQWTYSTGVARATYAIAKLGGDVNALQFTFPGAIPIEHISAGFEETLADCDTCKPVVDITVSASDLSNQTALRSKTSSALQQNPDANAITYPFDSLALVGPAASVVESGRDLVAVGNEGAAPNIALIREDKGQTAAIAFSFGWSGWAAVDTLNRSFAGEPAVPEGLGLQAVDRGHNLPAPGEGYEVPVDYRQAYLDVWGTP